MNTAEIVKPTCIFGCLGRPVKHRAAVCKLRDSRGVGLAEEQLWVGVVKLYNPHFDASLQIDSRLSRAVEQGRGNGSTVFPVVVMHLKSPLPGNRTDMYFTHTHINAAHSA